MDTDHCLSREDFTSVRHISAEREGGFNQGIIIVRCRRNKKLYVEKRIGLNEIRSGHAVREANAMTACCHPNIIEANFTDLNPRHYGYGSIFMTYCELDSLHSLINRFRRRAERFPEGFLWKVLWDMSLALCYLQTGIDPTSRAMEGHPLLRKKDGWDKILHRDIKPANIFLTSRHQETQYPTVVLGDFGCSLMASDRQHPFMTAFTKPFAAPEEPSYSDTSDVYSLALSVHCLAELRGTPCEDKNFMKNNPASGYSRGLNDLLARFLKTNPHTRPDVGYLPYLVFREMMEVRSERERMGLRRESLPSWAFER